MKVKMKVQITGSRNGVAWPPPGETVDLPDAEGAKLCKAGYAEPVAQKAKTEKATPPEPEKRGPLTTKNTKL